MRPFYRSGQRALSLAVRSPPAWWRWRPLRLWPSRRPRRPAAAPKLDSGDTAWMLTSVALVLMMTIPGLALFYGGMVRKMNVLSTVMQSFAVTCLVTVLWTVDRLQLRLYHRIAVPRRFEPVPADRDDDADGQRSGPDHPRIGLHVLSDDLCDHHPGADLRRHRRSHEILRALMVHRAVEPVRLRPDRALGVGRRRVSSTAPGCSISPAAPWCTSIPASPA